mgnify:CR=1 FL=1
MKINPNIAANENGLLFNPSTGESFQVNPVGARLIELLKKAESMENIKASILAEYDVEESTLEKDVADFIHLLKTHSLLQENE